jgi:hypothetical protein
MSQIGNELRKKKYGKRDKKESKPILCCEALCFGRTTVAFYGKKQTSNHYYSNVLGPMFG